MSIDIILQRAKYWSVDSRWDSGIIERPDFQPQNVSAVAKSQIETTLTELWNGGRGLGAQLLREANGQGTLRFAEITAQNSAAVGSPEPWIGFNPNYAAHSYYFNDVGTLVQNSQTLTMAHELSHLVRKTTDPNNGQVPDDAMQNVKLWDAKGQTVRNQNSIALDLGMTDKTRASYGAAIIDTDTRFLAFSVGVSYTENTKVDIVRLGDQTLADLTVVFDNDQNHSTRTDGSRDLIFGLDGIDQINGGGGNDWLYGGTGNDTIRGGSGYDVVYGDDKFDFTQIGNDWLYGDGGNDRIYGGKGTDTIYGGTGVDILVGGAGGDFIYGDAGNDTIYGDFGVDDVKTVESGVSYDDIIDGGAHNDTIYGGIGDDSLNGGTGLDILWGDEGDDVLGGGDGDDILYAGPGNDSLVGGKGDDVIDLSRGAENATILYIKSDGLDTVRGPTGSNITLSFIDLAANQLNFEFRYTSVAYTFKPDETRPQFYDTATYQGDLHIVSKISALSGLVLEGASVVYQRYPYYQEYLHPGLQKITFATGPTIVTASGVIIFGFGVGNPDIDISFVEGVTLPAPAHAPAVFGPNAAAPRWGENTLSVDAMTDIRGHGDLVDWFESGALSTRSADYAFA